MRPCEGPFTGFSHRGYAALTSARSAAAILICDEQGTIEKRRAHVRSRLLIPAAVAMLALPVLMAACGDDEGNGGGGGDLSGTIRIDGSSTVAPLSEPAGE